MRTGEKIMMVLTVMVLMAGCSVYRDYTVQDEYASVQSDSSCIADIGWRDFFEDEHLRVLIGKALGNNADMNVARQRVLESQASLKAAKWAFFPSVSASPSFNYNYSEPRYSGSAESWSVPVNASWEVDLGGGLYNRKRKAEATLEQSGLYVRSLQTELVATVAEYYYTLLKLDAQLEISRTTAASWTENVRIMKAMKEAGMTNEASVAQTEANACSIEASLYDLEYQVGECERALCVLIGIEPEEISRGSINDTGMPDALGFELPVQMLSRRSDVRQAEMDMRLAYYDTAIAKAAFYPSVRITPSLGWDKAITSPAGWLVTVGSGLTQPLFARGALKSALTIAEARQEEAAIAFRQILLKAGSEVSDALALCSSAQGKTDVRIRQINALESAVVSTRELMHHSESTYLEVLTAQQSLLSARLLQVSDRYDLLKGTVSLYRALGGGAE